MDQTQSLIDQIARRRTQKVLRDPALREPLGSTQLETLNDTVGRMLSAAHCAPFHKAAHAPSHCQGELTSRVPWRVFRIEQETCWKLIDLIAARAEAEPGSTWARAQGSKIPPLLAAAGTVLQVNWCPSPDESGAVVLNTANSEHIAAAAAAVQNMLLVASAAGLASYWSTGGILREPALQASLGIEPGGQPLASLFLGFPLDTDTVKAGAMRDQKGNVTDWSKTVSLSS